MAMVIGKTTVDLGSDAANQAFANEVYGSNGNPGSPLLLDLLNSFAGTITVAVQAGISTNGNTISVGSASLPGSNNKTQALTWAQLAAALGHELAHDALPYGVPTDPGSDYVKDAVNPAGSTLIGERNESVANAAEYIVALQLHDTSIFRRNADEIRLGDMLASDANSNNVSQQNAASIQDASDLIATPYYQAVVGASDPVTNAVLVAGNLGQVIDGVHTSVNENLTYVVSMDGTRELGVGAARS